MVAIISQVVQLSVQYNAEAKQKVEDRLREFKEDLLKLFVSSKANPEALKEPDFQYMLGSAQEAYARSGEASVKDTLVDIIARRSKAPEASREALALNDAASRAPKLTTQEFASLSIAYILKYTISNEINSIDTLAAWFKKDILPFIDDLSTDDAAYWHIDSQSVGSQTAFGQDLRAILIQRYGGLLGVGFELSDLEASYPDRKAALSDILCTSVLENGMYQPRATSKDVFLKAYAGKGFSEAELNSIWAHYEGTIPNGDEFVGFVESKCPGFARLWKIWSETPLKSLQLNAAGLAIAHANAVRVAKWDAPLSEWIK